MNPRASHKSFKPPYFSVSDKSPDKVQEMLDERKPSRKALIDDNGSLSVILTVIRK
jgi:hypothetical protein